MTTGAGVVIDVDVGARHTPIIHHDVGDNGVRSLGATLAGNSARPSSVHGRRSGAVCGSTLHGPQAKELRSSVIVWGPGVHTLRVSLRDVEPTVWRRIVVPSETKLPKLARWLEAAMGWEGYHLHSFNVAELQFGAPDEDADDVIEMQPGVTVKQVLPGSARACGGLRLW